METKNYVCPQCGEIVYVTDKICPSCSLDLHPKRRRYSYNAIKGLFIGFAAIMIISCIITFVAFSQIYNVGYYLQCYVYPIPVLLMTGTIISMVLTLKDDENDHSFGPFFICYACALGLQFFSFDT